MILSRSLSGLFLALVFHASSAGAQAQAQDSLKLPEIKVVTAARSEEYATDIMASVSVITREDIVWSAAEDLLELLRLQTGVDVVRAGPAGAQTSVFLRGGNSDHLLVLIDGVRAASAHTGAYAWELLPLAQIERIEIVRGPRAALYGSDAMGGVIQIFTRQLDAPTARLTAGSFGTAEAEAGLGASTGHGRHSVHVAWRRTDGFSAQNPNGFSYDPDDDGFESRSAGASGEVEQGAGHWAYRLLAAETETEFDQGVSEATQWLAALSWHGRVSEAWSYQVQAGYVDDDLFSDYRFFTTGFDSRRLDLGWQNRLELTRGRLGFGLDWTDESGSATGSYRAERHNGAGYALWDLPLGRADLQLGGRFDHNSEFGSEATWQAAAGFDVAATGRLNAQWGTAFRAPDLGEQFSPGFGGFFAGNPDLAPESSSTLEFNWRQQLGPRGHYAIAAYSSKVDDLIAYSGANFQAINIDRAELRGVEAEFLLQLGDWSLRANATLQRTEDKATGESLLRRPDRKGSFAADRRFTRGGWVGFDWFVSGPRLDVGARSLPGYGIFSLRGGWPLAPSLSLELRLDNLLDTHYEPAAGFDGAGRAAFVSLDWQP